MLYLYGIILTHIIGGTGYFYTHGNEYFLIPGAILIFYNMYQFGKISALILSPNWTIELAFDEESTWREKLLVQGSALITLAYLYKAGYFFMVGFMSFYSIIVFTALLITICNIDMSEGDNE